MKIYKMVAKYPEDLDPDFGFEAINQKDADIKAIEWNRYHGHCDAPGWGWSIAVEVTDGRKVSIHNEYMR